MPDALEHRIRSVHMQSVCVCVYACVCMCGSWPTVYVVAWLDGCRGGCTWNTIPSDALARFVPDTAPASELPARTSSMPPAPVTGGGGSIMGIVKPVSSKSAMLGSLCDSLC